FELVGEHQRGSSLGADDRFVIFGRDELDELVVDNAGRVDGAVETTDATLGGVERLTECRRVGQVGGDDGDLRPERFELGDTPDAAAGGVVAAVAGEPKVASITFGHLAGADHHQVGLVHGRQVAGQHVPDAAQSTGDQVGAAVAEGV